MSVKSFKVDPCNINAIRDFIEEWHYSHNVNGLNIDYCFVLQDKDKLPFFNTDYYKIIGGMIYGQIAMANVWKRYVDKKEDIIELRRLCCIDDTPKNTESYFIGCTLRWLKKNTYIKKVISYADEQYGHKGIIYRATNFKYLGMTSPQRIINYNGKIYHDKTLRNKHSNIVKPYAIKLKNALDTGKAFYETTKGKHIYIYELRK